MRAASAAVVIFSGCGSCNNRGQRLQDLQTALAGLFGFPSIRCSLIVMGTKLSVMF